MEKEEKEKEEEERILVHSSALLIGVLISDGCGDGIVVASAGCVLMVVPD